jgi:hypothetical protein
MNSNQSYDDMQSLVCLPPGTSLAGSVPALHGGSAAARPKGWRRIALFWSVSGGTVLSVLGFVAMILFQQYSDSLAELRNDLKHFNETSAEFSRKESVRNRFATVQGHIKELQAATQTNAVRDARMVQLEQELKTMLEEHKEMSREIQRLRERLATVEGRQSASRASLPVNR